MKNMFLAAAAMAASITGIGLGNSVKEYHPVPGSSNPSRRVHIPTPPPKKRPPSENRKARRNLNQITKFRYPGIVRAGRRNRKGKLVLGYTLS